VQYSTQYKRVMVYVVSHRGGIRCLRHHTVAVLGVRGIALWRYKVHVVSHHGGIRCAHVMARRAVRAKGDS
jgi:hypothetical protein